MLARSSEPRCGADEAGADAGNAAFVDTWSRHQIISALRIRLPIRYDHDAVFWRDGHEVGRKYFDDLIEVVTFLEKAYTQTAVRLRSSESWAAFAGRVTANNRATIVLFTDPPIGSDFEKSYSSMRLLANIEVSITTTRERLTPFY